MVTSFYRGETQGKFRSLFLIAELDPNMNLEDLPVLQNLMILLPLKHIVRYCWEARI